MVNTDLGKWASSTHIFRLVDPKFDRRVYDPESDPRDLKPGHGLSMLVHPVCFLVLARFILRILPAYPGR
jgi:hypothetical protein